MKNKTIDHYKIIIKKNWNIIEKAYCDFIKIDPIIEYDIDEAKVFVYSGAEYLETLSERTRQKTKDLFLITKAQGDMLVFIKDSSNKVLKSYVFTRIKRGIRKF